MDFIDLFLVSRMLPLFGAILILGGAWNIYRGKIIVGPLALAAGLLIVFVIPITGCVLRFFDFLI